MELATQGTVPRRLEGLAETLRKYLERGARANISKLLSKLRAGDAAQLLRGLEAEERQVYAVDEDGRLAGVTSLRQLLLSPPEKRLGEVMNRSVIKVSTETDQEEVAQLAARYDLLAIPVTDEHDKLVGIVTVDDIIDVVKEEATEDFYKLVGTSDDELLYAERSLKVARIRLPWLLFARLGIDPAVASAPLVTTGCDLTGILIFFGLASLLIEYLLR